jgi:drug/metabolite transporter (DMT)-like permease
MTTPAVRNNLIGITSLALGIFVFSIQDTIIKSISGAHSVTLAIFLRSIVSFPILLAMVQYEAGVAAIFHPSWRMLVFRGVILFCAYIAYYTALAALQMAEVTALFSVSPGHHDVRPYSWRESQCVGLACRGTWSRWNYPDRQTGLLNL